MGIVFAFGLGCLGTIWWKAKPHEQKANRTAERVTLKGNPYVTKAMDVLRRAEQGVTEIRAAKVLKNPIIDDELKDILLEHMIDQIKKGKIKVVEDND